MVFKVDMKASKNVAEQVHSRTLSSSLLLL